MKKAVIILAVSILTVSLLAGCNGNTDMNVQNEGSKAMRSAEDFVENTGQSVENAAENIEKNVESGIDKLTGNNNVDTSDFIGEEKAKEIALKKAGFSADGVTFTKVDLDSDDGVWQYEVEFKKDRTEYDADIKANDGAILGWDVDYDD